jgi:hypothetical protein
MIVTHLALKGRSARAVDEDPTATLGRNALASNSVRGTLGEAHLLPSSQDAPSAEVHRGVDDADQALPSALDENPFAPVRQLSRLTHISPTIVDRRLTESLGFTARHLQWVPAALSDAQKAH